MVYFTKMARGRRREKKSDGETEEEYISSLNEQGKRKLQSRKRYVLAFIIGTLIFIFGFLLTYSISYFEFQRISDFQGITSYNIFDNKLRVSLFNEDICSAISFKKVSDDLAFQGAIIDDLEKKFGKNNKDVLFRKKFYNLVELEHFEFVNQVNEECNKSIPTILFFYSNEERNLSTSEDAGKLLDSLKNRNPELLVYSFDINLDSELIEKLIKKYEIEISPTIILNDRIKLEDFRSIDEIEAELGSFGNGNWDEGDVIRL